MTELLESLTPLLKWLPAFAMIVTVNVAVTALNRPLGGWRWPLALFVALAPLTLPPGKSFAPETWGVLSLFATTLTIVTAARLPDLDHSLRTKARTRWELFVWMSLPMARFRLAEAQLGSSRWRRAGGFALLGASKHLAWFPLHLLIESLPGDSVHWTIRSAVLMLYFVLNATALTDLASALTLLLGSDVDELFDAPLLAYSPRDFWSRRWNKFINRFALKHVALKLRRGRSPALIIFVVFATSGVFHEYFSWGVSPGEPSPGYMTGFFVVQGLMVWLGTKLTLPRLPHLVGTALTFVWMSVTAPFFFVAVIPSLAAFGYPSDWLPFFWL